MIVRVSAFVVATIACGLAAAPASAHRVHHHRHGDPHHYRHAYHASRRGPTIGLGDTVISGRTGLHRSDFGVMVPDSEPGGFIATGRASGSGPGANGVPGSNQ